MAATMWQLFVLLLAAAGKAVEIIDGDAFGGSPLPGEEASPGQFPYQVGIWASQDGITSQLLCSGAVLTKHVIITSAHCAQSGRFFNIVFGTNNITGPAAVSKKTSTKLIHEKYVNDRAHDIALLYIKDGLPYFLKNIQPVKLPSGEQAQKSFWKSEVTTSGWGVLNPGDRDYSPVLRFVKSKVVHNLYCSLRYYFQRVYKTNICVKSVKMCQGDSGNPLVVYDDESVPTLVGIASFGVSQSCETSKPAKFTRVTSYLKWIEDSIKKLEKTAS
ncbi:Collagenase [Frankliniella fusca]|uniref:Collagenase n=1 Tax=Frankliniella fusca TaxID=407009 RepID=A0AAE1HSG3_9NEOP|nr:Collagenase [Frankliniella fusca]